MSLAACGALSSEICENNRDKNKQAQVYYRYYRQMTLRHYQAYDKKDESEEKRA